MRASICLSVGFLSLASLIPAVAAESWSSAEKAAVSGWKDDAGKSFGKTLERAFSKEKRGAVSQCAKDLDKPDLTSFTVLLRIGGDGVTNEVLVKPESNLAVCVKGKLEGWNTPPPPHADFWAKLEVKLKAR